MGKLINWTEEQKEWMRKNYLKFYDEELTVLFNNTFNTSHPMPTIRGFRQRLGIKKPKYKYDGRVYKSIKVHYPTEEERQWLRENRTPTTNLNELTEKFNKHFNLNLNKRRVLHICLSDKKGKIIQVHRWTKEEEEWLREHYKDFNSSQLAKLFAEKFGIIIKAHAFKNKMQKLGLSYLKANNLDVYNKKPIGTITCRKDSNGRKRYLVKVDDKGTWEEAGRYFYKKYYGEIPDNSYIYYLDGDTSNFAKENLIALTNSEIGTLRARCVNEEIDYFGQGILTKAMVEIIKLEKEINDYE